MKKTALIALGLVAAITSYGQGSFLYNNIAPNAPIFVIGPGFQPNTYAGSDYSVSLLWAPGPVSSYPNQAAFDAVAILTAGSTAAFFGETGTAPAHGPLADGAGLFDGAILVVPGAGLTSTITVQLQGWSTASGSYQNSVAKGLSSLVQVILVDPSGTTPPNGLDTLTSFNIVVPEPSSIALAGLGLASLLIFRRRK